MIVMIIKQTWPEAVVRSAAVGGTVTLLRPPLLPFGRRFNMDGEGTSEEDDRTLAGGLGSIDVPERVPRHPVAGKLPVK